MQDCLLKLKSENQLIIDRLSHLKENNDKNDKKYKELLVENLEIQDNIENVKLDIKNMNNWEICQKISDSKNKLTSVTKK